MTREILNAVNVSLDLYSVILSLIIAGSILLFQKKDKASKWFAYTNIAAIMYGITDILMWISEGTDAAWKLVVLPLSSFFFYFSGIFIFFFYIGYIINYYRNISEVKKYYSIFSLVMVSLYLVFLLATPFFGGYYTITPDNVYERGKLFNVTIGIEILLYIEAILLIFKFHKNVQKYENIGFASFIFIPFTMHIIQIANYGIALNSFGLSLSFIIIFINQNQKINQTLDKTQDKFEKIKNENIERQHKTIFYLANLIENRDFEDDGHAIRLTKIVEALALKCKDANIYPEILTDKYIKMMVDAVPFHDIGKIAIPEQILKKPGKLDFVEIEQMQKHTIKGAIIAEDFFSISYDEVFIKIVKQICRYHHEKWNGRGYPENLKRENIPLCARFVSIAETFDALVNYRCYKKSVSYDEAFNIIRNETGEQFDPLLAKEFIRMRKTIIDINEKYKNNKIEG